MLSVAFLSAAVIIGVNYMHVHCSTVPLLHLGDNPGYGSEYSLQLCNDIYGYCRREDYRDCIHWKVIVYTYIQGTCTCSMVV